MCDHSKIEDLAKLGSGAKLSPTVMVGDKNKKHSVIIGSPESQLDLVLGQYIAYIINPIIYGAGTVLKPGLS